MVAGLAVGLSVLAVLVGCTILSNTTHSLTFEMGNSGSVKSPVQAMSRALSMEKFCEKPWYVIGNIPTPFETGAHNAMETYTYTEGDKHPITVDFTFKKGSFEGKEVKMKQRGWIENKETKAEWRVQPKLGFFYLPVRLPYLVMDVAEDYSYTIIGYPDRSYLWIMARQPTLPEETYTKLVDFCVENGYDSSKIRKVPQKEA